MNADDLPSEPSFRYTRADALRDRILLDITATAGVCAKGWPAVVSLKVIHPHSLAGNEVAGGATRLAHRP